MALSDEIAKSVSERYCLIKITPALRLNTFLTVKSGTIYQATLTNRYEISSVLVDGTAYTVSTTVNPTASKYYYDLDSGAFEINFNAAIGTKQAILFFNLRFTDSAHGVFDDNGTRTGTPAYQWLSRVSDPPEFDVSVKDMTAGVTSISSSRFEIINEDSFLNSYLGTEFSYFNKACAVTLCINEIVSAKFAGKLRSINPVDTRFSFEIYDSLYSLDAPCLMGDTNDESYLNSTGYPNVDPNKAGFPIPYVIGRSKFRYEFFTTIIAGGYYRFNTTNTSEASCITKADSLTWAICRSGVQGFKALDYGDIATTSPPSVGALTLSYGAANNRREFTMGWGSVQPNIELLDTIEIINAGTTYQGVVLKIDEFQYYGMMKSTAPAGAYTVTASPNDGIGLMLVQGANYYFPTIVNDYTLSITTLASGNKLYKVVFSAGFEANHPTMTTINFRTTKLYYRFTEKTSVTNDTTHGKATKLILEGSGLTVDSASITTADAVLSANVTAMIPEFGQTTYQNFAYYLGKLMRSTMGYVYQDNSTLTMKYKLFAAPTSGTLIFEQSILDLKVEFIGSDMGASVRIFNDTEYYLITDATSGSIGVLSYSQSSTKSKYLHDLKNERSIPVMTSILTVNNAFNVSSRILAFSRNIRMLVTITMASVGANLNIGDDISVNDDRIPGDKATVSGLSCSNLKIIGISFGSEKITLTCTDYKVS